MASSNTSVVKLQSPFERLKIKNESPEVALARAIILQAIIDGSSTSRSKKAIKIKNEALEWIFGDSQNFLEICTDANFEIGYVRQVASEMIQEHNKKQE